MNAANHSAEFRSLGRTRPIAGGVIVLFALTLAAPLALADGSPQLSSFTLDKTTPVRNGATLKRYLTPFLFPPYWRGKQ